MNCEWVKENVTLYLYNELADDARHELEQHCQRCVECSGELESVRQFQTKMTALPQLEVSPNLLALSRVRLSEALESEVQVTGWKRFVFDPTGWFRQFKFSPAVAMLVFMVGFGGGIGTMYRYAGQTPMTPLPDGVKTEQHELQEASIASIQNIQVDPNSNQVEIKYNRSYPEKVSGNISDPEVQRLLLYAARNNYNSGLRMDSVDLLTKNAESQDVREALTYSLRYDNNPGVRLKALEGLSAAVREDVRVRNAVLDALLNDSNPGVRLGALHALEPARADTSVRQALRQLAKEDPNDSIRTQSRRVLATMPEID
jgi:anti-sigma factor RsiW